MQNYFAHIIRLWYSKEKCRRPAPMSEKSFFDILFYTDRDAQCREVFYGDPDTEKIYSLLFNNWIHEKRHITSVLPISLKDTEGSFIWDGDSFLFKKLSGPKGGFYYLLLKEDYQIDLYRQTLNHLTQGVQIYDRNGYAVFFNQTSRKISQIPSSLDVQGKHLLDLFALDEEVSTTMTALRTQAPVINRVDHFRTSAGISILSANTAYPLKRGKQIIGAAAFEQTRDIVGACKESMIATEQALNGFKNNVPATRFSGYSFENVIGHGKALQEAVSIAKKIAPQNNSVLLVGETGTGKEIFAQSIHRSSKRSQKKFVALNCAAIPDSLIESMLFGTQKGSFTGSENRPGFFEEAQGGTLFLDELNSMSLSMQSKILRALQENSFRRVGGQKDISMDVRIISSCNKDPFQCIADNQLRKDLFYRLSTVMIELPPLSMHMEDLEELIQYHLSATAYQYVHNVTALDNQVMDLFKSYSWPGNVRELFHVLDYAQNLADGDTITLEHLPSYLLKEQKSIKKAPGVPDTPEASLDWENCSLQSLMDDYENKVILKALEHFGYNITQTAQALGLRRQSLQYRIHKYGIHI